MVVTLSASKDTYLSKATPTSNYGGADRLRADHPQSSSSETRRSLLSFTGIPPGAVINSALLKLTFTDTNVVFSSSQPYTVAKCTRRDWAEGEATWNQYKAGSSWSTAGGDYVTTNPDSVTLYLTLKASTAGTQFTWDVTEIVQDAADNGVDPCFIFYGGYSAADVYFASREHATASQRPVLVVDYDLPIIEGGGSAECSVTATGSGVLVIVGGGSANCSVTATADVTPIYFGGGSATVRVTASATGVLIMRGAGEAKTQVTANGSGVLVLVGAGTAQCKVTTQAGGAYIESHGARSEWQESGGGDSYWTEIDPAPW